MYLPKEPRFKQTQSGIIVPFHYTVKRKKPTAFDFFAGVGGMSMGFIQAGFEVVGACEWDPYAALTYMVNLGSYPINIHYIDSEEGKGRLNTAVIRSWGLRKKGIKEKDLKDGITPEIAKKLFGDGPGLDTRNFWLSGSGWIKHNPDASPVRNFWFGDIRKLKGEDILADLDMKPGDLDVVMGGPPCQGYSRAGKQQIADPRNNLVYEFGRLIIELQPKTFVMEEVPDIVNFFDPDGVPVLDKFCHILQDGGYGRWDMLKKSLLMQTDAGACLRSQRGNATLKQTPPTKKTTQENNIKQDETQQMTLFG